MMLGMFLAALQVVAVYCPNARPENSERPLVGILDGRSPSDVSTEIALASNAGVDVFLYDCSPDDEANWRESIEKGFFAATNSQGMKFAIRGHFARMKGESFIQAAAEIGGRYFTRPDYWRRDGRPVLVVADATDFVRALGEEEARRAIASVRERMRRAGVGDFALEAEVGAEDRGAALRAVGFDSVQTVTVSTGEMDPAHFEKTLRAAKSQMASSPHGSILLDAWNDYAHGRYLLPYLRLSDQRLRCVGRVFGRKPADVFVFGQKKGNNPKAPNGKAMTIEMPTLENEKYGPHPRQGMDVWLPRSAAKPVPIVLFIHGGGWVNGDRMNVDTISYLATCRSNGVAFATVSYRLLTDGRCAGIHPPVAACLEDAVTAVRYVQAHAREWNVDPRRIGLMGGSAGACSSLYASLQTDCALGIRAVFAMRPQTSLDPDEMRTWIPNIAYGHSAFGYRRFDDWIAHRRECLPWVERYSPIALLRTCTPEKAPVFLYFAMPDPPSGKLPKDPTHAGMFCTKFREVCTARGVSCRPGTLDELMTVLRGTETK